MRHSTASGDNLLQPGSMPGVRRWQPVMAPATVWFGRRLQHSHVVSQSWPRPPCGLADACSTQPCG